MDITITTAEFLDLQQRMSAKDIENAKLKEMVAQKEEECNCWKVRALKAEAILSDQTSINMEEVLDSATEKDESEPEGFIVLSVSKLKKVLPRIRSINILSVIALVIQKCLHRKATAEEHRQVAELVPLPELPSIHLTAEGGIDVDGDWNDIHDNTNVNL